MPETNAPAPAPDTEYVSYIPVKKDSRSEYGWYRRTVTLDEMSFYFPDMKSERVNNCILYISS
jgi:hypothetical protein